MLKLYHCNGARSMRSLWLLNEMGIDFELKELPFSMEGLRTPEYLAISPLGRVPCLVDGDVAVFESGAIAQYLGEHYDPEGKLHRPVGHPERTEWLIWLHYAETMAVHGASLVQQKVFIAKEDRSPVVQKLESRRLEKSLEVVDRHLADRDYLLKSGFSAVDTNVGYSVHLAKGFVSLDPFSNVVAYYERLAARPAFKQAAASVPLNEQAPKRA
ncbi:glutathione S-transferase family protein [Parvibaculum sp.]|jgi:glutathione S-transferase|uniref:glutathione S-transferase family protein n=1 Tax=Parvibaculum sp. TaxID=2024848 RepID=UPI001B159516|nr:glutathione S-transferase family protein [Parvibaculum sp.]MBO6633340.1 glutathione S-transferase family protein [Parvibaculum sp.]MBO6678178.1 glutathione S-transferase family protein [Parvibaculum sp.]MBO6683675.1 glutathione S-transferase family protein [Parvibaculum sp.]MBO6905284.1 glutathione S-transferase family protein [Parvibaculum sp.]